MTTIAIDEQKLNAFLGQFVSDLGAATQATTIVIGDKLGLYKALAANGPSTSTELAAATGTVERYVREWLRGQAAGGYVSYEPGVDGDEDRFHLTPEQAFALADEDSPAFVPGAFWLIMAEAKDEPRITEAFRSGAGVGWHEHHPDLFYGIDRFFRPGYLANLTSAWLPALTGVTDVLEAGGKVADVGCGLGASTIMMARAFPRSTFVGFDYHDGSIGAAVRSAGESGVADRCRFEMASAADYGGADFDLVTFFDCLHDMGDPVGAARHVRSTMRDSGTWMIVEPFAHDRVADNLNPVGRIYYNASTMLCVPHSLSQPEQAALGAQAGPAAIEAVVREAGFGHFRRAAETPFNIVYEVKP